MSLRTTSRRSPKRFSLQGDGFGSPMPGRRLEGEVEVRYVSSVPDQRDFEMWIVKGVRDLPSLAAIFPSIGWYEREMMDLNGLRFADHPEPYPLVLKDSGEER